MHSTQIMGGFAFYGSYDDDTLAVEESLFEISTNPRHPVDVPKFETLIYIMEHFPHIITDITEDYILDRAASSSLSKALLIVQVGGSVRIALQGFSKVFHSVSSKSPRPLMPSALSLPTLCGGRNLSMLRHLR
jgi:hypothetical protein